MKISRRWFLKLIGAAAVAAPVAAVAVAQVNRPKLRDYSPVAEFIEKGVRPPMMASADLRNEPASIMPGHMTYVSSPHLKLRMANWRMLN